MRAVRPTRTRVVAALAAVALGSVLTGCGSDEPRSADQSTDEPTTAESSTTSTEATDEPSAIDDGGQVAIDEFARRLNAGIANTKQAHLVMTMTGAGGEMSGSGDVDYTRDPPEMQMTMKVGPQSIGMVLVDGKMYVKSSQAGGKYFAFDLSDPTNPLGAGFAEQLDPAASMKTFVRALKSVVSAGRETVDGRQLDRYELTVDTTQLADQQAGAQLPADMKVTVWLDDKDRMARSVMDMGAIKYDATMTDFEKALDLRAPPAGQVTQQPAG